MSPKTRSARLAFAALLALPGLAASDPASARADNARVERAAPDRITVTWSAKGPVDVYLADRPDADPATARLVSARDRDGHEQLAVAAASRPYLFLRDRADGSTVEVSERLVPLEQGSNFRDIGGYSGADGKHVRWGLIYRSGASPLLTEGDLARVKALGLRNLVDLRSVEERVLAPTRIDGVPYAAVGYSMTEILRGVGKVGNGVAVYHGFPTMLAPQLRILFDDLKRGDGPVAYNCSAGQDRTGFATAMILTVLGVSRDQILADYHLSTRYRQPQFELPPINLAAHPGNQVAAYFAHYQSSAAIAKPQPLYESDGTSYLDGAFSEIDQKWGSVQAYLEQEAGVSSGDIALLRQRYLQ